MHFQAEPMPECEKGAPSDAALSELYFADCKVATCTKCAKKDDAAAELWDISEKICRGEITGAPVSVDTVTVASGDAAASGGSVGSRITVAH